MQIAECNAPVAKNIAGVIENKGLKQVYIAEKAGYSPQELNDMLNGRRLTSHFIASTSVSKTFVTASVRFSNNFYFWFVSHMHHPFYTYGTQKTTLYG